MVSTSLAATCNENSYCDRSNTNSDKKQGITDGMLI